MSLVYTTLLSLVPLLAIIFSVLKGFGVHNQIEPLPLSALDPLLGEKGQEVTARIVEFVDNVKVGLLGSVGLGLLIYTVVSLMQKIERASNYIWYVSHNRPLVQRFSEYLGVILIGPVLVFSALGITASSMSMSFVEAVASVEPFGILIRLFGRLVPYVLVTAAFTLIYVLIPNTKVKVGPALVGAIVAAIMWETAGWSFASLIVGSTKYTAIYSAFAILIMFLIWLHLSWLILLMGASVAYYHQNPEAPVSENLGHGASHRTKEKVALAVVAQVAARYSGSGGSWTLDDLAKRLAVTSHGLAGVLAAVEKGGILKSTNAVPPTYLPAKPLETTGVIDALDAIRSAGNRDLLDDGSLTYGRAVENVMERVDRAVRETLKGHTLKALSVGTADESGTMMRNNRDRRADSRPASSSS